MKSRCLNSLTCASALLTACASLSAVAQSQYDKTQWLAPMQQKCERDELNNSQAIQALAALKLNLHRQCECVAEQTISQMTDEDMDRALTKGALSAHALDVYLKARKSCVATLTQ
jgi:hypothetical protein